MKMRIVSMIILLAVVNHGFSQTFCDTISNIDFTTDNLIGYESGGSGDWKWVSGQNQYGDVAKADYYNYVGSLTHIEGVNIGFVAAAASNTSNTFNVNVWDGTGGTPGAILTTTTVTYHSLVTAGMPSVLHIPFTNTALPASKEFFVGIEFSYVTGDVVAMFTNTDPETDPPTAWEQWSDLSWHTYDDPAGWGFKVAHHISPVLAADPSASFSQSSSTVYESSTIGFTNTSTLAQTYEWVFSGGTPGTSTAQNPVVSYETVGTYDVTLVATNACRSDMITATNAVTVVANSTGADIWEGDISSDWNDDLNWSANAVPTASDHALIPNARPNYPHVTLSPTNPAVCNDLTVESGANLTIDAAKAMTVSGATSNSGTITIKADATGIGSLITQGTVSGSGTFEMEQYLIGSGGATPNGLFYYVGNPVVGATASGYDVASGNKLWRAVESTQNYTQISNGSTVLDPTQGYVARMGASGSITLSGTGFNTGNQSASGLTRTGTTASNRGYNLVSNPYPSTVNWDDLGKTDLETTMWYRTHQGSTMLYDTYNATGQIGTNNNGNGAVDGTIPPTQAFWVRVAADGNTGQLDFSNAMRSHGTLSGIYRLAAEEGTLRMTLSNGTTSDEAILLFSQDATDDFDAFDSHKFWTDNIPQLYMSESTDTLVINGLNSTASNPIVDLGLKLPSSGEYSLNTTGITLNEAVFLEDRSLNLFQDLNEDPSYTFTSEAGNISDRFALHFGMSVTGLENGVEAGSRVYTANGNQLNIILSENSEKGSIQVLDMAGRMVHASDIVGSRSHISMNVNAGVYLVRVVSHNGTDIHKVMLR